MWYICCFCVSEIAHETGFEAQALGLPRTEIRGRSAPAEHLSQGDGGLAWVPVTRRPLSGPWSLWTG